MDKNELKRLLATMNTGELHQLFEEVKRYTTASETVDSIKHVFNTGHMIEFIASDGKMILVDNFLRAEPIGDKSVRMVFSIFGIVCDYQLAVDIDVKEAWTLCKRQPYRAFAFPLTSYLLKKNPTDDGALYTSEYNVTRFLPIKGLSVCKLVHNVYDTGTAETGIEDCALNALAGIRNKVREEKILAANNEKVSENETVTESVSSEQMLKEEAHIDESSDKVFRVMSTIASWLGTENENRRILLDVSRCFTYEDGHAKTKANNNFSMSFKKAELDKSERTLKCDDTALYNGVYTIKAENFINGSVKWDGRRKSIVLMSEDKTFTIRISFMINGKVVTLDDESMSDISTLIAK
jgi:hypothetical protein